MRPPARIAAAQELHGETEDRVVLVVVVRDERFGALVTHRLVIAVDVAEMTPPVFVEPLALVHERVGPFDRLTDEGDVGGVWVARLREQVSDSAGRGRPGRIDDGNER